MWWQLVFRAARNYAPYITLPFAAVVGFVGYNLENILSRKYTPYSAPVIDARTERLLSDDSLSKSASLPKQMYENALDKNLSPSLV